MTSSSFSHSPSSGKLDNQVLICYCGEPAPLRTSNIPPWEDGFMGVEGFRRRNASSSCGLTFYLVIAEGVSCCRSLTS
ncbi:hypothetical protein RHGRI_034753 [Rhododendron griersonianum]|uniref:Uncharacterized protein n=1 Tax=Rhododendron griersonianum TaxID=479676 RepID=A0AAV6I2I8_9ERIC|nr:hypothetical protein RHGRI_034753 [Rhododendron griersonianum]